MPRRAKHGNALHAGRRDRPVEPMGSTTAISPATFPPVRLSYERRSESVSARNAAMERPETMESKDLLARHGIPFTAELGGGESSLVIDASTTEMDELRRLGFRLGRGAGEIRYLLYYHGHFCGVVR